MDVMQAARATIANFPGFSAVEGSCMKPSGRGTRAAFFLFAILVTIFSLACGDLSQSSPPNPTPLPLTDLRVVELGTDVRISDSSGLAKPSALAKMARSIW